MNVLLLTQFLSTTKGGGEYTFSLMAKLIAESGHKVWVVTNKVKNEEYHPQKNLEIVFVPPELKFKGGEPSNFKDIVAYCFNAFNKSISIIKKNKVDVIHSNNFAPALTGSLLSIFTGKPHITTIHDVLSKSPGSSNPHNVVKATFDALLQLRDAKKIAKERGISLEKVFNG